MAFQLHSFIRQLAGAALALGLTNAAIAQTPPTVDETHHCLMSLSPVASYEVWPGVNANKVGRFRHTVRGTHFYSANYSEAANLCSSPEWRFDGLSFRASSVPFQHGTPVYRFRHKTLHSHFYTASGSEYMNLLTNRSGTWTYEGIAFYAPNIPLKVFQAHPVTGEVGMFSNYPLATAPNFNPMDKRARHDIAPSSGLVPVYRLFSPTRGHLYTTDMNEARALALKTASNPSPTYTFEGTAFWAFAVQGPNIWSSPRVQLPQEMRRICYYPCDIRRHHED